MSKPLNTEMWESISKGLPAISPPGQPPVTEILKTIQFCLAEGVEEFEAAVYLADLLAKMRNDVEFLNWKAMVEYDAKQYVRSFNTIEQVLEQFKTADMYYNAGRAALKANKLDKSEEYLRTAMGLKPQARNDMLLDYAVTISTMGRFQEAAELIESIDVSTFTEANKRIVEYNKGWQYVNQGNFKQGMKCLHEGRLAGIWGNNSKTFSRPEWDGQTHPGKTILILGEAGIGDEIINSRFSQIIKERGMNCVMSTVHKNTEILQSITSIDRVFDAKDVESAAWDYWVPCMDLPYALGIDSLDIPSKPYISVDQYYIDKWTALLNIMGKKKFNIGIRWMGNPRYELELGRTIPAHFFSQLNHPDVQLWSLQKDDGARQMLYPEDTNDIAGNFENWSDTMGAMKNMDLVITSCTSVAHVAGALGIPTWVVVPLLPYYTWADMKPTSYWYDSVRVYRQETWGDWTSPMNKVKTDLFKLLESV